MVVKEDSSPWRKNYFFAVEGAIARQLESVAVLRVDEGRGEVLHEVTFDAGALRGEVRKVSGTFEDCAFGEAQVDFWLEEKSTRDELPLGDDHRASTLRGQLIDEGVDLGTRQVETRAVDNGIFNRWRRRCCRRR